MNGIKGPTLAPATPSLTPVDLKPTLSKTPLGAPSIDTMDKTPGVAHLAATPTANTQVSPVAAGALAQLHAVAGSLATVAQDATNSDTQAVLAAAAKATQRVAKQLDSEAPRLLLHLDPKRPSSLPGTMERRLRDGVATAWFRPHDATVRPFAIALNAVVGIEHGGQIELSLESKSKQGQTYKVLAPPESYATSMLARVALSADGQLVAQADHISSAYPSLPIRGPQLQELVGKAVVVQIDATRTARIVEVVDKPNALEGKFLALAVENGVTLGRSAAALDQLEALIANPPITGKDLTHIPFVTMDNPTSKDLDQALHIAPRADGGFVLNYAIADVAQFIPEGSALDREAQERGFTTYMPHTALSMLPKELCEDLVSLNPNVKRRAFVVTIHFGPDGQMQDRHFERGVVQCQAKLAYGQVQRHLDMGSNGELIGQPYTEALDLLKTLGSLRIKLAKARGVVDVNNTRGEIARSDDGFTFANSMRFMTERYNEQISLAANEAVGAFLQAKGVQTLHRVELPPDEGKVTAFRDRVAALGLPWHATQELDTYMSSLDPKDGRTAAIQRMATRINRRASYDIQPIGHHALRLAAYDHFTAPMRRFSDFVTHRVLAAVVEGTPIPYQEPGALDDIMQRLDQAQKRETSLGRAIEEVVTLDVVQKLAGQQRKALVLDVQPSGATVRLADPPCEVTVDTGLLRRLTGENFVLAKQGTALSSGTSTFTMGDTLSVTILGVDEKGRMNVAPSTMVQANIAAG